MAVHDWNGIGIVTMLNRGTMLNRAIASTMTLKLSELHSSSVFYTPLEARFDRITRLTKYALKVPVASISLVNDECSWFKSVAGWNVTELPRHGSFCSMTIDNSDLLVIEDAAKDPKVKDHPLVIGSPKFRFYAGIPLFSSEGLPIGCLGIYDIQPRKMSIRRVQAFQDIGAIAQKELLTNELRDAQAEFVAKLDIARRQASIDELTRVWARRAGIEMVRTMVGDAKVHGGRISVCVADIDNFKEINDTHGHQCGDHILRKVAMAMVSQLRSDDVVCRYGGDEFLLAFQDIDREQLCEVATRIRRRVGEERISTRFGVAPATISVGGTVTEGSAGTTLEQLINCADQALYRAKARGRDRVEIASWRELGEISKLQGLG